VEFRYAALHAVGAQRVDLVVHEGDERADHEPVPGRTSAGTWYVIDLPPPVGMSTTASPPATTCATMSA
jgi:hypothetical protein